MSFDLGDFSKVKLPDGIEVPFYEKANENDLVQQKKDIAKLIETGNKEGFISDEDAKEMAPSGKPGRLYGNPKTHKDIPEGGTIPPCRPIVSQCGSNTEFASKFVDFYAKDLMKQIPSFCEDSADILRKFEEANSRGLLSDVPRSADAKMREQRPQHAPVPPPSH